MAEAKAKAEELLAQYEAGEHTEDAFAAIGDAALEDGTAAESARYEDITPGPYYTSGDLIDRGCHVDLKNR